MTHTHLPPGAVQVGTDQLDDIPRMNAQWGPALGTGDATVVTYHQHLGQTWRTGDTSHTHTTN